MCEIELSHMGKNSGNLDLVCEKTSFECIYFCVFFIFSKNFITLLTQTEPAEVVMEHYNKIVPFVSRS